MSERKSAIKQWPDKEAQAYLNAQYPNEKIKWVLIFEESLYGMIGSDGTEFAMADDDEIRNIGIIEFLERNGGFYVSG